MLKLVVSIITLFLRIEMSAKFYLDFPQNAKMEIVKLDGIIVIPTLQA